MRVLVDPPPGASLSKAMYRVAAALRRYAPPEVECAAWGEPFDVQVLHVIGPHEQHKIVAPEYVPIQYCYKTAGGNHWAEFWKGSRFVWSYYDLPVSSGTHFFYAPMGVDPSLFWDQILPRQTAMLTSGFVHGSAAEAIEEPALAAFVTGCRIAHLGPAEVVGMKRRTERTWRAWTQVGDSTLATLYSSVNYVSGLRHVEGFEMPVLEGMLCGTWGVVFDRPEMRQWYGPTGAVVFLRETEGSELVEQLIPLMHQSKVQAPLSAEVRAEIAARFSWENIATRFWKEMRA